MTATQFLELAASLCLQVALVVAVTHWLRWLVRSERIQCRLWMGCYVIIFLLVFVALLLPHPRLFRPWASVDNATALGLATTEYHAGYVLFFVWLIGVAISLILLVVQSFRASRFLKTCRPVDPDVTSLDDLLKDESVVSQGILRQKVRLLSSSAVASPFCWEFHQPFIVVPESLLRLDGDELRYIVRHELEHLRKGHFLQLFLQRAVEVVFWFHPMVWWAAHQSALSREFACDEAAVDSGADIVKYLRVLLTIVEQATTQTQATRASLSFGRGRSIVAARARRLVHMARSGPFAGRHRIRSVTATVCLMASAVLTSFFWLPVDVLASTRADWSPWPSWSAHVLHDFGIHVRDFEVYDRRSQLYELLESRDRESGSEYRVKSRGKQL